MKNPHIAVLFAALLMACNGGGGGDDGDDDGSAASGTPWEVASRRALEGCTMTVEDGDYEYSITYDEFGWPVDEYSKDGGTLDYEVLYTYDRSGDRVVASVAEMRDWTPNEDEAYCDGSYGTVTTTTDYDADQRPTEVTEDATDMCGVDTTDSETVEHIVEDGLLMESTTTWNGGWKTDTFDECGVLTRTEYSDGDVYRYEVNYRDGCDVESIEFDPVTLRYEDYRLVRAELTFDGEVYRTDYDYSGCEN